MIVACNACADAPDTDLHRSSTLCSGGVILFPHAQPPQPGTPGSRAACQHATPVNDRVLHMWRMCFSMLALLVLQRGHGNAHVAPCCAAATGMCQVTARRLCYLPQVEQ
eukprot:364100-Chlamydomonas_euryale.AAC.76